MAIGILFLGVIFGFFIDMCNAEDEYVLSIEEPSYALVETLEKGGRIYATFDITIALYNSGTIKSNNITVEIKDRMDIIVKNKNTVPPKEYKSFIFKNVEFPPDENSNKYTVYITYNPTDPFTIRNNKNAGEYELILSLPGDEDENSSTPGFEIVIFITVVFLYALIDKYKK